MRSNISPLLPFDLRVEYKANPLGIDTITPRLSWKLGVSDDDAAHRGQMQFAYQIVVASTPAKLAAGDADLWDSGKIFSNSTVNISYEGRTLSSGQTAYWQVVAWDRDDVATAPSEMAFWQAGIMDQSDWRAEWIHAPLPRYTDLPAAAYMRGVVELKGVLSKATLFATALGVYEPYVNGTRVGDAFLAPGWTDYSKRVAYQTYDVTSLVNTGSNAIGAILGDGWYAGYVGFQKQRELYGDRPHFLAQVLVEYTDRTSEMVGTDGSWTTSYGPIQYSDLLQGELFDARLNLGDWSGPDYDASSWTPVAMSKVSPDIRVVADVAPAVRITERIAAISVTEAPTGSFIFDLGQNFSGIVELKASGPAGTMVRIRHAEMLNTDGTLYVTNIRAAKATDTYILSGASEEILCPTFTFHGFRYVELTGYPLAAGQALPPLDTVTGCVLESDTEATGSFECSHPMVNQLWTNVLWGQRGNFLSVPTDCPQRDERLGWMADAQIFIRTATYNRNIASFMTKWMQDVVDAQMPSGSFTDFAPKPAKFPWCEFGAPAWADAGVIVPWTLSQVYGDKEILRKHYDSLRRYFDYLVETNPELLWTKNMGNNYGDWLSIDADTDKELLATAYFAHDASLMTQIAFRLGEIEDAERYQKFFAEIKAEFVRAYVERDGQLKGHTQAAYVVALRFDLLDDVHRALAVKHLVKDIKARGTHLSTGFVGVGYLCPVLSDAGYDDVAYSLLLNDTFPSWGYSIKHGATTIWERWDGWTDTKGFQTADMNSFNHYSLGSVGEWLYRYVAGIDLHPSGAGFETILLQPRPDKRLSFAKGSFDSVHGLIQSEWRIGDGQIAWSVTVPPNTTATAIVPTTNEDSVMEGGRPASSAPGIHFEHSNEREVVFTLRSGTYRFTAAYD
ncbi:MAG TPA: glycoside hydrolase family 78 protein [Capsulimonadaceae bacterium]|jgi:alpha-L-rhamnosidase